VHAPSAGTASAAAAEVAMDVSEPAVAAAVAPPATAVA